MTEHTRSFLFLGGPKHGEHLHVNEEAWTVLIATPDLRPGGYEYMHASALPSSTTTTYQRVRFGAPGLRLTRHAFMHQSVPRHKHDDVMYQYLLEKWVGEGIDD